MKPLIRLARDVEYDLVDNVEGVSMDEPLRARVLLEGERMLCLEALAEAGQGTPAHVHDHESICYVVRGNVTVTIDGHSTELGPGDTVMVPPDVEHSMMARTDTVWVEIKSPPRKTW